MQEDFLHFLWRWRRFDLHELRTTAGDSVEILHPGESNTDAGPDFFNARVRLGDTLWAGNVEIHLRASDWLAHRHDTDPAYENVILHVVLEEDLPLGAQLPCLELKRRIPPGLLDKYRRLCNERSWIPCAAVYGSVPELVRNNWLDRLLVERLEEKTIEAAQLVETCGQNWEEAFYRLLTRNFGLKINTGPFEAVARGLPLRLLAKHQDQLFQLEALLFGQAGLLNGPFTDEYPRTLAREYQFLQHKYGLSPLVPGQLKFFRLRPSGFPSLRLAQLAALLHRRMPLLSRVLERCTSAGLERLFQEVEPSAYWSTHFRFDKSSEPKNKPLGREFVHLLLINTVAPFLFHYGRARAEPEWQDCALQLLESLPPEANRVVEGWSGLGQNAANAAQTQALLQLKNQYCSAGRCLECAIGTAILR